MDFHLWWDFYHSHSFKYINDESFHQLILEGVEHLSCLRCTNHAKEYFRRIRWSTNPRVLFNLHNNINVMLHKPMVDWAFVEEKYGHYTDEELLNLKWRFLCMIFVKSKNPEKLFNYVQHFVDTFDLGITFSNSKLAAENRQFYLYTKYLDVGGTLPVEKIIYLGT